MHIFQRRLSFLWHQNRQKRNIHRLRELGATLIENFFKGTVSMRKYDVFDLPFTEEFTPCLSIKSFSLSVYCFFYYYYYHHYSCSFETKNKYLKKQGLFSVHYCYQRYNWLIHNCRGREGNGFGLLNTVLKINKDFWITLLKL